MRITIEVKEAFINDYAFVADVLDRVKNELGEEVGRPVKAETFGIPLHVDDVHTHLDVKVEV